jgi:hypothetical protein
MGKSKEPLTVSELAKMEKVALKYRDSGSEKDYIKYKIFMVLRSTGMHSCCLYRPESDIRVIDDVIIWKRPMKGKEKGKKNFWEEVEGVPKYSGIDFDIKDFYKKNLINRRKPTAWNVYIHTIIKQIGLEAGIPDASPNSIRHTVCMYFLRESNLPRKNVAEKLGCSIKTLDKYYDKLGKREANDMIRKSGW